MGYNPWDCKESDTTHIITRTKVYGYPLDKELENVPCDLFPSHFFRPFHHGDN